MKRVLWLLVSCLVALALVLPACQPAAQEGTEGQTIKGKVTEKEAEAPAEKEEEEAKPAAPAEGEEGPQYGGTLSISFGMDPVSWDPAKAHWSIDFYTTMYLERLLTGDLDKGPRGTDEWPYVQWSNNPYFTMKGQLAESWEVAEDGTSITFYLRKGIHYQDKAPCNGRELVADDVKFSFEHLMASPQFGIDKRVWWQGRTWHAPDKYTVRVDMPKYSSLWFHEFDMYAQIVPPEVVEAGAEDWKNACGTGPFILEDFVSGVGATYVKNPNYWDTAIIPAFTGKEYKIPFVDKVQFINIPDPQAAMAAFRTGKLSISLANYWVTARDLLETVPDAKRVEYLDANTSVLHPRVDIPPFDDIRVRKAASMALDRDAIIEAVRGGKAEILSYPTGKLYGPRFYTPLEELPEDVQENFRYDPEKARELLAQAGYPNGFETTILISSQGWEETISLIVDMWADVGIQATMELSEPGRFYTTMFSKTYPGVIAMGRGGTRLPDELDNYQTGHPWNPMNFSDPKVDQMIADYYAAIDPDEAARIMKELNVYLLEQIPNILIPTAYVTTFWWPWVKNYYGEATNGFCTWAQIHAQLWIDQDLKKEFGH